MPGTSKPNTNLSWDTKIWTAAAVVKPDTRVSDRYTTINPNCRIPMASYKEERRSICKFQYGLFVALRSVRQRIYATWKIPTRKVIEEATRTLFWSDVKPSNPGMLVTLAWLSSSGTRRFTTAPTMRLRTGNEPLERWVWKNVTFISYTILSIVSETIRSTNFWCFVWRSKTHFITK